MAEGAEGDDANRLFRSVLCSRRKDRKEQFGEIEVPCKENPSVRTRSVSVVKHVPYLRHWSRIAYRILGL